MKLVSGTMMLYWAVSYCLIPHPQQCFHIVYVAHGALVVSLAVVLITKNLKTS